MHPERGVQKKADAARKAAMAVFASAPGDRLKTCLVFLAPDKGTLDAVSFRPNQEFDPIRWTGEIVTPKPEPKKDRKNDRKKDRTRDRG